MCLLTAICPLMKEDWTFDAKMVEKLVQILEDPIQNVIIGNFINRWDMKYVDSNEIQKKVRWHGARPRRTHDVETQSE